MTIGPRRFALLAPNYSPVTCGVGDHSMRLAAELMRYGHEAVVFSRAPAAPNAEHPEVPVVAVQGRAPLVIATEIARRIEAGGFSDVLIQYAGRMWGASRFGSPAIPMLAARLQRSGVRVSLIAHELFLPWRLRPDLALGGLGTRLQLAAIMRSCRNVFVTTESRRRAIAGWAASLDPPCVVDVVRIGPNALPVPRHPMGNGRRIGLFSTLAFGKRFDVVIDAFEIVHRRYPDATLTLIGDLGAAGNHAAGALLGRIAESPARDGIRVTGKLPLARVADAVAALDVYLFPMDTGANTRSGTLPLALGTGVPVVATNGIETDSLFADGENVLFASALTGPAFADATLRILGDPSLADRLGKGGERLYAEQLCWARVGQALLTALA